MEKHITAFVERVNREGLSVEGFTVLRGGKQIYSYRWSPERDRNVYSNAKSFLATAAGIAIAEGKLSLDDSLAEYFPYAVPENVNPALFEIKLRHLLTMSSGFDKALLMGDQRRLGEGAPDYLKYMFSQPVLVKPGSRFSYSTADSILAGRMIEQKTGKNLGHYLYEKIFQPLCMGFPIWECCPMGHPIGGGGLFLSLTNMMKLGQLYLDNGRWQGEQLVDPQWIMDATTLKIDTTGSGEDEWNCGYGYQFWMSPYPSAYRADGAYGQVTTVLPEAGMVIGIQCPETDGFSKVRTALHEEFLSRV